MERHKCKLCTRTFANGRALGGHMKAHLAALPLPPKMTVTRHQLDFRTESSSSYSSSGEDQEEAASLAYWLRENPKKSFKFADPEFSFAVDDASDVQDRESETESRNPTRRRSKQARKLDFGDRMRQNFDLMKLKPKVEESPSPPAEPEPVSSVSDSPEEDVARCLMMLSRDVWLRNEDEEEGNIQLSIGMLKSEIKVRGGKLRCEKCTKQFRSSPALLAHKKICSLNETEPRNSYGNERIFDCLYCLKVFGSGQALGGHERSHLRNSDSSTTAAADGSAKMEIKLIDLNLPAPMEEDEFSEVSDA